MKANFETHRTVGKPGGSDILDTVQDFIARAFTRLGDVVQNDKLITVTFGMAETDVKFAHGLGHVFLTWEVVRQNAAAVVWDSPTVNDAPDRFVILRASAPVTVVLRVG